MTMSLLLAWLLFLPLLPVAVALLWRAYRISRGELRYVAPWNSAPLPQAQRWAAAFIVLNVSAGAMLLALVASVLVSGLAFKLWVGGAALTFWLYYMFSQLIARRARVDAGSS